MSYLKQKEGVMDLEAQEINKLVDESNFKEALIEVLKVRSDRAKIYGSQFIKDPDWALLAEIRQKYLRTKMLLIDNKSNNLNEKQYEKLEDTLIDLCNYSLFLLQKKIKKIKDEDVLI